MLQLLLLLVFSFPSHFLSSLLSTAWDLWVMLYTLCWSCLNERIYIKTATSQHRLCTIIKGHAVPCMYIYSFFILWHTMSPGMVTSHSQCSVVLVNQVGHPHANLNSSRSIVHNSARPQCTSHTTDSVGRNAATLSLH